MGEITYLNKATNKGESLRTTVPMSIVKQFGLTENDHLESGHLKWKTAS